MKDRRTGLYLAGEGRFTPSLQQALAFENMTDLFWVASSLGGSYEVLYAHPDGRHFSIPLPERGVIGRSNVSLPPESTPEKDPSEGSSANSPVRW